MLLAALHSCSCALNMEEGPEIFPRMSNASVGRTCGNIEAYFDLSFKIFSNFTNFTFYLVLFAVFELCFFFFYGSRYVRQRMGRNKLKSFGLAICRMAMLVHIRSGSFFFKALGITLLFMAGFPDDLVQRETKYRNLDLLQKYYRYSQLASLILFFF